MRGPLKSVITAGILLLILAVPAFLFVFLHTFGENEFNIPVYYQEGLDISQSDCSGATGPYTISDFSLTAKDSSAVTAAILERKISIVHFPSSSIGLEVPSSFAQLVRVMETFNGEPRVQLLSISASTVSEYPKEAYAARWHLLSGASETIASLARCGFILPAPDLSDLPVASQLTLVDGQKRIRGYYNLMEKEEMDRLITEIEILKSERNDGPE